MKVTQVLFSGLGGHASVAFSLVDADIQGKWEHDLLFYGIEELKPEYEKRCQENKISFGFVKKKIGWDFKAFTSVLSYIKNARPDVILLHSTNLLPIVWLYCVTTKCRLVMVEHTANQVKRKSEWVWSWMSMWLTEQVVLLTQDYYNELKEKLGFWFRTEKVSIIPNGIDVSYFKPAYLNAPFKSDKIIISMVARFTPIRDQATLIKATELLTKKNLKKQFKVIIAGDGDTLTDTELLRDRLNITESVQLPGMLTEPEIKGLLQNTSIYVHATHGETMSTSIMQALSCGLPVVASDIPGVKNLIKENNGLLFQDGNEVELASVLEDLISNPAKCQELSKAAREYAINNLSNIKMFEKYDSLIRKG